MTLELFTDIIEIIWNSIIGEKLKELNANLDLEWSFEGPLIKFKEKEIEYIISVYKFKSGLSHTEYANVLGNYGARLAFNEIVQFHSLKKVQQFIENSITQVIANIQQAIITDNKIPEGGEFPLNKVN